MIVCVEGIDNVGKDTQIKLIQPLFTDKPLHILHYSNYKGFESPEQTEQYSYSVYKSMFNLLYNNYETTHFILNRSHIGEYVYAPMYRNYNGDYIFNMELYHKRNHKLFWNQIKLITFIDEVENLIKRDDGLSHTVDPVKKQKEIDEFVDATEKSNILHKKIININGKDILTVFEEVKGFLK
jgi:hypothetical protein